MKYFRDSEKFNELSVDDGIEVFSTILLSNSNFKKELFDKIFSDYCVTLLDIIETKEI